ncbi:MAG: PLP-dependent aminotransferase family protein, partial [Desulfuromonas sp.]
RLLESGAQEAHLLTLKQTLSKRKVRLCEKLRDSLPGLKFSEPEGGYFVWVDLGEDGMHLLKRAAECGVSFMPGQRCAVSIDAKRYARLSFAFYSASELEMAVDRLRILL